MTHTSLTEYAALINNPGLNLEPCERQCAILWVTLPDPDAIARTLWAADFADAECLSRKKRDAFIFDMHRRVRFALHRVAQKLEAQEPEFRTAVSEFRAAILDAVRNSRSSKRTAQTFTGVKPYGALDDEGLAAERSWPEYVVACADPANYQEVTMRGALVTRHDLPGIPSAEKLIHLARHCAAQVEFATI